MNRIRRVPGFAEPPPGGGAVLLLAIVAWLAAPMSAQSAGLVQNTYERHLILEAAGESSVGGYNGAVAGVGDVNGDSIPDFIVGSPLADPSGFRDRGTAVVYSGKDGTPIREVREVGAEIDARFGHSVAGAGDVDGDGIPDVIVGAPRGDYDFAASTGGSAYVYSGRDGRRIWEFHGRVHPNGLGDLLGWSVAGAGDVNGDGFADVIVGAPDAPAAHVYSGKDGSQIWEFRGKPWGFPFRTWSERLGYSVAGAGDVNQDGFADVIVGVPDASGGGAVHVYSGKDGTKIWQFEGGPSNDLLGWSVAGVGDMDRDGVPDVAVGDLVGGVFVYSGRDGTEIWRARDLVGGWSVAAAGDVNLDGFPDVVVGSPPSADGAGSVFTISGKDGATIARIDGEGEDRLGVSVAGVGNVNNDLWPDIIVGVDGGPAGSPSAIVYTYVPVPVLFEIGSASPRMWLDPPDISLGPGLPRIGDSLVVELTNAHGASPSLLAMSLAPSDVTLHGMRLYGDFLTPGVFTTWGHMTNGLIGLTNGSATQPMSIPNDPALSGLTTYWQWFVMDSGSALPIGVSHTAGIGLRLIR